ncbi:L-2-amino-thiazoline-4-carboxylic acid hydrolase [uncultured archaeon]|nr:L-2-amino-thiazoline-4-carboxylic acid hydrolase [uncultured archaeon]
MKKLTDKQIAAYFHRSYAAADGLWFMKVEEKYGFDTALEIDDQVWKVLPKIQARMLKSMLLLDEGLEGLCEGIETRLALEGFEFEAEKDNDGLKVFIKRCPWHELMVKSGRENLSEKVSSLICREENSVWASEFGDINFELDEQICRGSKRCMLRFDL